MNWYDCRMKVQNIIEAKKLIDIPNIGPAMVRELKMLHIYEPQDLQKQDGFQLYKKLCNVTQKRFDPCVLDTFLAIVDFANGATALPWWHYTKMRKQKYPNI